MTDLTADRYNPAKGIETCPYGMFQTPYLHPKGTPGGENGDP